ncbi:MAG: ClbS/DfsB family four-helix bundle protein [Dehalococcoidia bacterium]
MTEQAPKDTAELLAWMDNGWRALTAELDRLAGTPAEQLRDHEGWTIADHLVHLAAWEASALAVVRRRPRYEGLGIPGEVWEGGDEDGINARLHALHEGISFAAARQMLETAHADTVATVAAMPIEELLKPVDHYLPGEPSDPDLRPAGRVIFSNSGQHFTEHLTWIRALAG